MTFSNLNDLVWPSSSEAIRPNIPLESCYGYPKCGRVYGPFINECPYCNKPDYTITCMW